MFYYPEIISLSRCNLGFRGSGVGVSGRYKRTDYLPAVGGGGGAATGLAATGRVWPQSGSAASIRPSQSSSKPLLHVAGVSAVLVLRQTVMVEEPPSGEIES